PATLTGASIATQHGNPPAGVRGNLTSTTHWLNTGPSPVDHLTWFDTGEVHESKDPMGHTTTYTYDSLLAGAYPTLVQNPLNQFTTTSYDPNTGLVVAVQDPNDAANGRPGTQYTYDEMMRETLVSLPNGGSVTTDYNNDPVPPVVTTTQMASPSIIE